MNKVTVFVISCHGDPNYYDCLEALESQKPPFPVKQIRNVAPMSAAFQQMLDQCDTPYFVQCDSDMILAQGTVAHMLEIIEQADPKVAIAAFMLQDPHLEMPIQGVKIYRHEIVAKYPYNLTTISCEKNHLDRMTEDGYTILNRMEVVGAHSPKWTPELIFERYFDLMEKWKLYGYTWLEDLHRKLFLKYMDKQSELNLYAYLGAMASVSRPERLRTREKDFRLRTKEYIMARSWHCRPTQATLYLTGRCNLKCGWCLRQGTMGEVAPAPDFDPWMVDDLLHRFPTIRAVCLCGFGETLMHPNVPEVIRRAKAHSLFINLITNGTLLAQHLPALLRDRPNCISVSLNAANAKEHEQQSGVTGAWDKVMEAFELMAHYQRQWEQSCAKDPGLPVFLSRVCTAQNIDSIPEFLDLAKSLDVDGVDLHNVLPHDVGTPEKVEAFLGTVLTNQHLGKIYDFKKLPTAKFVRSWPTPIDPAHPVRRCEFIFNAIAVDGARNISICNSVWPPSPENGKTTDPKCWHNDYCEKLRLSFAGDEELHPACRYCFRNYQ